MAKSMEKCKICGTNTSGHRNEVVDTLLEQLLLLGLYMEEERYNQAANTLIASASAIMTTFKGCATSEEKILEMGAITQKLIDCGMKIAEKSKSRDFAATRESDERYRQQREQYEEENKVD